ncbi:MAG TPA: hypothetical protein VJP82_01405 [Sphingomicrobium sp.]|nr:hypothetical protein [Sphingomicrobium sp.]
MNKETLILDRAAAAAAAPTGPPRLPFVLSIGITGHRIDALGPDVAAALPGRLAEALRMITDSALAIHAGHPNLFSAGPPRLDFVSPLANGADQIAAEAALQLGYRLHAVLPFAADDYSRDMGDDAAKFDELLARAETRLELPGDRSNETEGYAMAGRATVAHCDLLIAVWDGLKARGRGGTGEVVEMAVAHGTPVIHLPAASDAPPKLLWAAFDPVVDTSGADPMSERPMDAAHVNQMLAALLLPPPGAQETKFVERFFAERIPRFRVRAEYAMLLAAAGVRKLRLRDFTEAHTGRMIREEWEQYHKDVLGALDVTAQTRLLEEAYTWADHLATHLAQKYRSGHIFSFVLGGAAVCMGLSAFMFPHLKLQEAFFETVVTVAIILNAHVATKNEWHRRWLDYRQLAERLRPMRSLKLLGIAAPDPPGTETNPVAQRWIDWYAGGIWRAIGSTSGVIDRESAGRLAEAIGDYEVAPQVSYHKRNAGVIQRLDERLEKFGTSLFFITLVSSNITLVGLAMGSNIVNTYSNWFTLVSAGFPALATAVFGIRFQGDFGGDALRSLATADKLQQIDHELRRDTSLMRAADLTEQAARFMLADLDEWRLVNQQRDLSVG